SPRALNGANKGFSTSLASPASLAIFVLSSEVGAPVSKISQYGPLPLTFTCTAMCPDLSSSNGTETGVSAAFVVSAATRPVTPRSITVEKRSLHMSDALGGADGDLFGFRAALHRQLDLAAWRQPPGDAEHVADVGHGPALDLGHQVAGLQPGGAGRALVEHGSDDGELVPLGQRHAVEAAERQLGRGAAAQGGADRFHHRAEDLEPALPAALHPFAQRQVRLVGQLRPGHLVAGEVDLHAVPGQQLVAHQPVDLQ